MVSDLFEIDSVAQVNVANISSTLKLTGAASTAQKASFSADGDMVIGWDVVYTGTSVALRVSSVADRCGADDDYDGFVDLLDDDPCTEDFEAAC